jgi:hypothetical protein
MISTLSCLVRRSLQLIPSLLSMLKGIVVGPDIDEVMDTVPTLGELAAVAELLQHNLALVEGRHRRKLQLDFLKLFLFKYLCCLQSSIFIFYWNSSSIGGCIEFKQFFGHQSFSLKVKEDLISGS